METNNGERYERQCILSEIGPEGQDKLRKAKVLLVGVGGLGSPISLLNRSRHRNLRLDR